MITAIRDRATFDRLSRAPRCRAGCIWVRHEPDGSSPPRVAFAIGRHVGGAVTRNRARRRIIGVLHGADALQMAPGAYLIGTNPAVAEADSAELRSAFIEIDQKVRNSIEEGPQ